MNILEIKENVLIHSYKGGLKKSSFNDLIAIESDKPFVWLIFEGEKILIHATLFKMEKLLSGNFVKINRQVIVNMFYVMKLIRKNGAYWVCFQNSLEYRVSERKEKNVRKAFFLYIRS